MKEVKMKIIDLIFKRDKFENPAKFNLKNIKKFLQGNFIKILIKVPFLKEHLIEKSKLEQYTWRRKQVLEKSPRCLALNECYCGCDTEGLILANEGCEQKGLCFPPIMNTLEWSEFKIKNNIK